MFRDIVSGTALTTTTADDFFRGRIYGDKVRDDHTFVSTLRALIGARIPDGESIVFKYRRSANSKSYWDDDDSGYQIRNIVGFDDTDEVPYGRMTYCRLEHSNPEANQAGLDFIEKHFTEVFPEFQRVQRVTDFYIKRAKILCYVNQERRAVFLFSGNINMRIFHYLQCGIYAMLPWYFATGDRPSDEEMEVIRSLREENPQSYKLAIKRIADTLNFREFFIRKSLSGFESQAYRNALESISGEIDAYRDQIQGYYRRVREIMKQKSEAEIKSLGLMAKIADCSQESEYMEYFLSNKNLKLVSCDGTTVDIVARGYLMFFDEDNAASVIRNPSGVLYQPEGHPLDDYIPSEDMKKLMTAVFLDRRVKMRMCAYYRLSRDGVYTSAGYGYGDDFMDCTPNPHIDRYRCLGNYEEAINTLLDEGDYIGATEQCIASCQSLNFGDYTVMKEFAYRLYGINTSNMNCFELPDGTITDPKGAIRWLNDEETRQAQAQEE